MEALIGTVHSMEAWKREAIKKMAGSGTGGGTRWFKGTVARDGFFA